MRQLFRTRNLATVSADCTTHAEHSFSRLPVDSLRESEECSHLSFKLLAFSVFLQLSYARDWLALLQQNNKKDKETWLK